MPLSLLVRYSVTLINTQSRQLAESDKPDPRIGFVANPSIDLKTLAVFRYFSTSYLSEDLPRALLWRDHRIMQFLFFNATEGDVSTSHGKLTEMVFPGSNFDFNARCPRVGNFLQGRTL